MSGARRQRGLSLVEVMAATVLLSLCLWPALEGLRAALAASAAAPALAADRAFLGDKLAAVRARPWAELLATADAAGGPTVPTAYSDTLTTPDGRQLTRQVFLARYDGAAAESGGDPFAGGGDGRLLWLSVRLAGTPLVATTLLAAP